MFSVHVQKAVKNKYKGDGQQKQKKRNTITKTVRSRSL